MRTIFALIAMTVFATAELSGQAGKGSITGLVTDSDGAVFPAHEVVLLKNGTIIDRAKTDSSGEYQFTNVAPGTYDVETSWPMIKRPARKKVIVSDGQGGTQGIVLSFSPCDDDTRGNKEPRITTEDSAEIVRQLIDQSFGESTRKIIFVPRNIELGWLSPKSGYL